MRKSEQISIVILLISALIVIPRALNLIGVFGDASAPFAVVDVLLIILGVGLFMRNELARRIFIALGLLGAALILLGSANTGFATVIFALVLQMLPVVFLSLTSVKSKFA
jgi:hypothetical protein